MLVKEEIRRSFGFNLLLVMLVFIAFYILFFAGLGWITRHGKEMKVPNVLSRDVKTAVTTLSHLGFEVDIDSAYDPKKKPYIVLAQMPDIDAVVKTGRTIFLTINKVEPPMTPMPNLLNLSYRSADLILKSNKLVLGDTTYKPDIAKGAILEQIYKGKDIRPGQMLPQGSVISLVIGDGLGNTQFNVPDVTGMSYDEAIAMIDGSGLNYTAIWEGDITDSSTAIVYSQSPKPINEVSANNRIKEGDLIDIRIKQNPTPEEIDNNKGTGHRNSTDNTDNTNNTNNNPDNDLNQ